MPRSEEANQRIREEQRTKILEAAQKVFAQKGRAATMADIATEASISQGLAYRYFKNKDEIFQTLLEQMVESAMVAMPRFLKMPGTPGERLDMLVTRLLEGRRAIPTFYQFFYLMTMDEKTPKEIRDLIEKQGLLFQSVLRQLIVEGQASGEVVKEDPDQLMMAIIACLDGLWRLMVQVEPEQFKQQIPEARIILRMVRIYPTQS